jgi:uncharacterized cupredoxin-like copper-binding protein
MTHRPKLLAGVTSIAIALVLAACSSGSSPSQSTSATSGTGGGGGNTVDVTETEFKIDMPDTVPSGDVTFNVTNNGTVDHEFVVFKTDDGADALPMASDEPEVNEDAPDLESMGEVEDIAPGSSKSFTATLEPGKYVAICNVEGHYSAGMHHAFTVQ